ncbi:MAG: hypothetical protein WC822_01295 [Candidatus Paceibacterota bacterium]
MEGTRSIRGSHHRRPRRRWLAAHLTVEGIVAAAFIAHGGLGRGGRGRGAARCPANSLPTLEARASGDLRFRIFVAVHLGEGAAAAGHSRGRGGHCHG